MGVYSAFGLTLASSLPFPELQAGKGGEDVVITVEPSSTSPDFNDIGEPSGIRCLSALPRGAHLRWDGIGELLIEDGRRISVVPAGGVNEDVLRLFVLGAGLGVLLHQRGLLVLHGSGVVVNGCAVGFVGSKGWGKSTTAMALSQRGHALISDELLVINFHKGLAMIVPGPSPIKLWADALAGMDIDPTFSTPVRAGVDKFYICAPSVARDCMKLDRLYLLDGGENLGIEAVPLSDAFFGVAPHVYVSRFGTQFLQSTTAAQTFRQLNMLVKSTPVFRLRRERNLCRLEDIAKLVEANCVT